MQKYKNNIKRCETKQEKMEDGVEDPLVELKELDAERDRKQVNYEKMKEKKAALEEQLSALPPKEEIEKDFQEAQQKKAALQRSTGKLRNECGRLVHEFNELRDDAKKVEGKLARLQDEKRQRKDRFFRHNPDTQKAYDWLEANRKEFRQDVFGPGKSCCVDIAEVINVTNVAGFRIYTSPSCGSYWLQLLSDIFFL